MTKDTSIIFICHFPLSKYFMSPIKAAVVTAVDSIIESIIKMVFIKSIKFSFKTKAVITTVMIKETETAIEVYALICSSLGSAKSRNMLIERILFIVRMIVRNSKGCRIFFSKIYRFYHPVGQCHGLKDISSLFTVFVFRLT